MSAMHTDGDTAALAAVMCGKGRGFFEPNKNPNKDGKKRARISRPVKEARAEAKKYAGGQDPLELL